MANAGGTSPSVFGARVRDERTRRGWRLEDLAGAVAAHGVTLHLSAYAKLEAGREPKLSQAQAIAAAFRLPLAALLVDASELWAEVSRLREQANEAGLESDEALRRAVQLGNAAQQLAATAGQQGDGGERRLT